MFTSITLSLSTETFRLKKLQASVYTCTIDLYDTRHVGKTYAFNIDHEFLSRLS